MGPCPEAAHPAPSESTQTVALAGAGAGAGARRTRDSRNEALQDVRGILTRALRGHAAATCPDAMGAAEMSPRRRHPKRRNAGRCKCGRILVVEVDDSGIQSHHELPLCPAFRALLEQAPPDTTTTTTFDVLELDTDPARRTD